MSNVQEDTQAIRQLAWEWREAWLAGDAERLFALYADDPVLMPQDSPPLVGKAAILPIYRAVLRDFQIQGNGSVVEIQASGDLGYVWSTYSLTATPKAGGKAIKSTGKSVFIVKRQAAGAWKIARLIDNIDGPVGDPTP